MDFNRQDNPPQRPYGTGDYQNGQGYAYQQGRQGAVQNASLESIFDNPNGQGTRYPAAGAARSLTREERLEAKRLMEEASFAFEGYQVVRREFMSHQFDPAMTIRGKSITFNNACISKLEDATYIQFLINPAEMKLVIRACGEGERDAVRWCIMKDDKRKSRQITCGIFTAKLYEMMGWDGQCRYKLQGMRITHQGEVLYLFDLNANEAFLPQTKDPETGKMRRAKPILPMEWRDSFGMTVSEHEASTKINLSEGFVEPSQGERIGENSKANSNPTPSVTAEGNVVNFEEGAEEWNR